MFIHSKWNFIISLLISLFISKSNAEIIFNGETMGTSYNIKIVDNLEVINNYSYFNNQIDSILQVINFHFSNYIDTSEISLFNNNISIEPIAVSSELFYLITKSKEIFKISNGNFDITINPLLKLWGFNNDFKIPIIPDSLVIDSVKQYVNSNKLLLGNQTIQKKDPYIQINLNAIAKGHSVDKISQFFKSKEINNYMIEIGGEIYVSGYNNENQVWEIGIRNPDLDGNFILNSIQITNKAVATSGVYLDYFSLSDIEYSHLINPQTGYPIKHDLVSAVIIADDCTTADGIATAVMIKGLNKGLEWINTVENIECLLIAKQKNGKFKIAKSNGFKYKFEKLDEN